jgi:hypothetical protein
LGPQTRTDPNRHESAVPRLIRLTDRVVRETCRDQPLLKREQLGLTRDRQRDCVGFWRQLSGRTLAGSMNELRGKSAQRQICPEDAVVTGGFPLRGSATSGLVLVAALGC